MTPRFDSFSIITADLAASLAFYRRLGLDIPDGAESAPHVEVHLPGGQRLLWDTEQVIAALDPEWKRPAGGERLALAFACDSAREVDTLYAELVAAGHTGHMEPWDATWGQRYAVVAGPGRLRGVAVRPLVLGGRSGRPWPGPRLRAVRAGSRRPVRCAASATPAAAPLRS